ncbi:hypothetical protein [Bartonella vinsonii]|uniref:Lipoprotein n=1 Tax=Bartonella vinsonii TaxID=33047 RepID=A0A448V6N8_BARVI|nr:hypothetical protein [Bartonella vinsonii]VEJ45441.1 Uncharacterised protein [Bartonella vinsonii]
MKKTLKLLSALLVMVGCYQAQLPQTIAGTWKKCGANQFEKKVFVHGVQEDFQNDPAFIEWCIVHDKNPECNPLGSRNPRKFSRTLGHSN